jgi:glutaredoxin
MKITIYSKPNCIYCDKSKALLKGLDLSYEEKMFGKDFKSPEELYEAVGKQVRTMPQIVIDDVLVGGYNQLVEFMADKGLTNFKGEKI